MEVTPSSSSSAVWCMMKILVVVSLGIVISAQTSGDTGGGADQSTQKPNTSEVIDTTKHDKVDKVKNLRVITIPDPPFVMHSASLGDKWRGLAIDILNEAVKDIGYDGIDVQVSYDLRFGGEEYPGVWSGMIGKLVNESADIAVGAITLSSKRASVIHFTQPFMQAGYRVLYKIPDVWFPSEAMVTLLRPFTPGLWVLLVLMFVVTSLGLYLIGRYSPYEDIAFVGKTATYDGLTLPNSLLYVFSSLVWQGYTAAPKSISGRVLTCVWWVFAVFTVGAYIAGLCVILFRVNPEIRTLPFTTLDEMSRQYKVGIMIVRNGTTHRYLQTSKEKLESRIYGKIIAQQDELLVETTKDGIDKMMESDGRLALLMEGPTAEFLSTQAPCDKMVLGEPLGHNAFAFACRNTSDVCNKMDEQILKMKETGKISEFKARWFHSGCLEDKPDNYIYEGLPFFDTFGGEPDLIMPLTITVRRFSAAFIVLVIGIVGAAICLFGEIYYAKRRGTSVPRKLERSGPDDDMERIDNEFRDERA